MSIRARTLTTILIAALLPLLLLGAALRRTAADRLVATDERRLDAVVEVLDQRIRAGDRDLAERLAALRDEAAADQGLELAMAGMRERAAWPDEFVLTSRRLTGFDLLALIDVEGTVVAVDAFADAVPERPERLVDALRKSRGGYGLVDAGAGLALVRLDSVPVAGETLYLLAGRAVTEDGLRELSGGEIALSLVYHGGALSTDDEMAEALERAGREQLSSPEYVVPRDRRLVRAVPFPRVRETIGAAPPVPVPLVPATLVLTQPLDDRAGLLRTLDLAVLAATGMASVLALLAAALLAARLTRPLRDLAARADDLDLDHLDVEFPPAGDDEVGVLTRVMGALRDRLRRSVSDLRASERRALLGDLARQVNHDLRNGFLPIRNVIRHLDRVAHDEPQRLPEVFLERERTLEMSLAYLENLAVSWKRHALPGEPELLDLGPILASLGETHAGAVAVEAPPRPLMVSADATSLRRILDNLVRNALDATAAGLDPEAPVRVEAEFEDEGRIRVSVTDVGVGMNAEQQARAFDMFHTTKPGGTGLGLPIVRRLVGDLGGEISIASRQDAGTTVTVIVPAAGDNAPEEAAP